MAHTCGVCGCSARHKLVVPDGDGGTVTERDKQPRRVNKGYSHDLKCWKRNCKARKQWARHPRRLAA